MITTISSEFELVIAAALLATHIHLEIPPNRSEMG